jgi:hypothetical protein
MWAAILALAVIGFVLLLAIRRQIFPADPGHGYVSQSWLAELRASEGSVGP